MTRFTSDDAPRFTSGDAPRSPREIATQKIQLRKQQEKLLSDLLTVVDALDRAADHWQQAEQNQMQNQVRTRSHATTRWQQFRQWLSAAIAPTATHQPETLATVVISARSGIDMIRETMLTVLTQHQVSPLPAQGQPFDPTQMHALGQQADASVSPNTVVQEVVRGYRWKDRILREARVIVAVAPAENN